MPANVAQPRRDDKFRDALRTWVHGGDAALPGFLQVACSSYVLEQTSFDGSMGP